ncbi:MAG: V-type ATP synthase subunit I [Candidatus Fimenecus sp.]
MIVPMKFVTLVLMRDDREAVLRALQKTDSIMLCEQEGAVRAGTENAAALRRMEKLLSDLKPYAPKKGLFAENPQVDASVFEAPSSADAQTADQMEALLMRIDKGKERQKQLSDRQTALYPWAQLSASAEDLADGAYTNCTLGFVPKKQFPSLTAFCEENGAAVEMISETEQAVYLVLAALKDGAPLDLAAFGFQKCTLPLITGTVADELRSIAAEQNELQKQLDENAAQLSALTNDSLAPQVLCDHYRAESDIEDVPFLSTEQAVLLSGWVPEKRVAEVEQTVRSVTEVFDLTARDPEDGEDVPTELENKKLVSQFEGITNMFSVPSYGGYDPNAVMAPWYWVIFGLMMGDAGYGLMMVVLISIVKKIMKPKGDTKKLINVLLYSSITTIICGVLFGSYFGETWHPILFSPLDDPVKMLIVTLGIGVAHIFTGLIVQIVNSVKAGHWFDAVCDQVSWILVISGICMIFLASTRTVGIVLACIGAAIILFTAGRAKKGVIGKITGGLVGLYGITNYLSDILSYSRILALSLATGVVGMVMNMLAGMIQGSVIGFICSILIYIVGHIFNLVLGLLSAYVHDCRLQYIEFYGKFYEGSGRLFKPLSINPKYIQIKENGGN